MGREALSARERTIADGEVEGGAEGMRLAVAMDGGRSLIRTNRRGRRSAKGWHTYSADWREPKMFIIYELDKDGRKRRRGLVRCDGAIGNPDDVIRLLVAEWLVSEGIVAASDLPRSLRRSWLPFYCSIAFAAPWVWRAVKLKRKLFRRG